MSNQKAALSIAAEIEARLNKGSDEHGNGQVTKELIEKDPRDWLEEAYEEALDLVFYLWAAIERRKMFMKKTDFFFKEVRDEADSILKELTTEK